MSPASVTTRVSVIVILYPLCDTAVRIYFTHGGVTEVTKLGWSLVECDNQLLGDTYQQASE